MQIQTFFIRCFMKYNSNFKKVAYFIITKYFSLKNIFKIKQTHKKIFHFYTIAIASHHPLKLT